MKRFRGSVLLGLLLAVGVLVGVAGPAVGGPTGERSPGYGSGWVPEGGVATVGIEGFEVSITAAMAGNYEIDIRLPDEELPVYLRDFPIHVVTPEATPAAPQTVDIKLVDIRRWLEILGEGDRLPDAGDGIMLGLYALVDLDMDRASPDGGSQALVVPPCIDQSVASPDPCVLPPQRLLSGDVRVTMLMTSGGSYEFAITCRGMASTIVGYDADDVIDGTPGDDVIWAGFGDDLVRGKGGNDVICLGGGNDRGIGGPGKDRIYGGNGADVLKGNGQKDKLFGGKGPDALLGGRGNDLLKGNQGNDTGDGGPGSDKCRVETATNCEA